MSELSTVEVLRKARKLIEDPERWTTGTLARNPTTKHSVDCVSPHAGQWCMWGAVERVAELENDDDAGTAWQMLNRAIRPTASTFADFNDAPERTHAEVLVAFDKAIELAERES